MANEQITLRVEGHFDAAHNLINYEGACARIHGHRWTIRAIFGPYHESELDEAGIAGDFKILKPILHGAIDVFDHQYLNNYIERPSAEVIGLHILRDMQHIIKGSSHLQKVARLTAVEVFESPESLCRVDV